jgi:hypothetical protein
MVFTFDCDYTATVGADHWQVYLNTGAGFAAAPTSWPLPTGSVLSYRYGIADKTCPVYATTDFTGDGRPDLVFAYDCAAGSAVGVSEWLVYPNVCN